jgi:hypothetical protein
MLVLDHVDTAVVAVQVHDQDPGTMGAGIIDRTAQDDPSAACHHCVRQGLGKLRQVHPAHRAGLDLQVGQARGWR